MTQYGLSLLRKRGKEAKDNLHRNLENEDVDNLLFYLYESIIDEHVKTKGKDIMRVYQGIASGDITTEQLKIMDMDELRIELAEVEEGVTFLKVGLTQTIEHMRNLARDAKRNNDNTIAFELYEEIKFISRLIKVIEQLQHNEELTDPLALE